MFGSNDNMNFLIKKDILSPQKYNFEPLLRNTSVASFSCNVAANYQEVLMFDSRFCREIFLYWKNIKRCERTLAMFCSVLSSEEATADYLPLACEKSQVVFLVLYVVHRNFLFSEKWLVSP